MNEGYKVSITKIGRYGRPQNYNMGYPLTVDALCAAEQEFEERKKEPGVLKLQLLRYDSVSVRVLRNWEAKNA